MATGEASARQIANREIVLTRVLEAPRELVFRAWAESAHVGHWWGPAGFRTTTYEMDVRPGGVWRFVMHGPDGRDYKNKIVFNEVVNNERLAYTHSDEDDKPNQFEAVVTFEEEGNGARTKLTLRSIFRTTPERDRLVREYGAIDGGKQMLERLAHYLSKLEHSPAPSPKESFVLTRVIDAPPDSVFKAWTDPERLKRWWGPSGCEVGTCKVDLRPGGSFLYSMRMPNAPEMWGKFVYQEITPPERLVFVSSFADSHGNVMRHPFNATWPMETLNTVTFAEEFGKTRLTLLAVPIHATPQELKSFGEGKVYLEKGLAGTFDQLAEYLGKG